jgi:hypothetical protein
MDLHLGRLREEDILDRATNKEDTLDRTTNKEDTLDRTTNKGDTQGNTMPRQGRHRRKYICQIAISPVRWLR